MDIQRGRLPPSRFLPLLPHLASARVLAPDLHPHDPLHARLIARATGCDVKCVHRQLARLARFGAIRPTDAGKEKWYRLRATCWKSSKN
jgi:predicted transcriptional regulator